MPYAYSGPLRRFIGVIHPLKGVARATKTATARYSQHVAPLRDSALSSTVLLGFAAFEEYVKQGVEEIFASAQANAVLVQRLPGTVRAHVSIAAHLQRWTEMDSSRLLGQLEVERTTGAFAALVDGTAVSASFSTYLLDRVKYPKPNNLRALFKRLGIANVYGELDPIARANTSELLTSFHDARTALAHQGIPPGWTADDFVAKLDGLMVVAKALDRVLWNWTRQYVGAACWPR